MPRNSSGVYTVPPGTPAVSLTTIASTPYNNFLNDISAAITQSLWTQGGTLTGGLTIAPASGGAFLQLAAPPGQQALITTKSGATTTWQFGQQNDNSFIIFDDVKGATALQIANGNVALGEPGGTIILDAPLNEPVSDNRIINGGFDVWQMGTVVPIAASIASYVCDQWFAISSVAASAVQQFYYPGTLSRASLNVYANPGPMGVGGYIVVGQRFEAAQIGDLDSQVATLSFDLATSTSAGSIGGAYAQWAFNTATDNSSFSNATPGVSFAVAGGGATQRINLTFPASSMAGAKFGGQFQIVVQQLTAPGNLSILLAAVKLAKGPTAQPWAPKGIAREIADCERYFEKSYDLTTAAGLPGSSNGISLYYAGGYVSNAYDGGQTVIFRQKKRVVPAVQVYSTVTGTAGQIRDASSNADVPGNAGGLGQSGFYWSAHMAAPGGYINFQTHWTADARL